MSPGTAVLLILIACWVVGGSFGYFVVGPWLWRRFAPAP